MAYKEVTVVVGRNSCTIVVGNIVNHAAFERGQFVEGSEFAGFVDFSDRHCNHVDSVEAAVESGSITYAAFSFDRVSIPLGSSAVPTVVVFSTYEVPLFGQIHRLFVDAHGFVGSVGGFNLKGSSVVA